MGLRRKYQTKSFKRRIFLLGMLIFLINCLTCDWIQNRIWTWTLLSLKVKHSLDLMLDFPLSNHHFQMVILDKKLPQKCLWKFSIENLDKNVKISFLNDSLSWIWTILMNRIPVRVTLNLVLQVIDFALASLNYAIFVIITQNLITERINDSRDRLRTGELEWFQILGETMGSCLTSWRFLPRWITHNSLMSNKINNAICIRIMTFTVLSAFVIFNLQMMKNQKMNQKNQKIRSTSSDKFLKYILE